MKLSGSGKARAVLLYLSLLSVHAYPGGQHPRSNASYSSGSLPQSTQTEETLLQSSHRSHTLMPAMTKASQHAQVTATSTYTVTKTQEVAITASSATSHLLHKRDHRHWLPDSPGSDLLEDEMQGDGQEEERDCEGEEEDTDDNGDEDGGLGNESDYDDDDEVADKQDSGKHHRLFLRRAEDSSCSEALSSILAHLENIESLLGGSMRQQEKKLSGRQLGDVVDQEQTYGNRGKDLTQEQRDSLEALVKGVNGYQGSLDGASNSGQLEKEAGQETVQSANDTPYVSKASPEQVAELLALLRLIEMQNRIARPSTVTAGSQAGQSASQATWMVPEESMVTEAAYSAGASDAVTGRQAANSMASKPEGEDLLAQLRDIRAKEHGLLLQIQEQLGPSMKSHSLLSSKGMQTGLHRMREEDLDDITSMVLADRAAKMGETGRMQVASTAPTASPSSGPAQGRRDSRLVPASEEEGRHQADKIMEPMVSQDSNEADPVTDAVRQASTPATDWQDPHFLRALLADLAPSIRQRLAQRLRKETLLRQEQSSSW